MQTTHTDEAKKFPKYVYKRGTGKKVDDTGRYEAEGRVVNSQEELSELGSGWCNSPQEAVGADAKKASEVQPPQPTSSTDKLPAAAGLFPAASHDESTDKHKKVK